MTESGHASRWLRWSVAACAAIALALWLGPYLLRDDLISDDASQHLFWMYRFVDPGYFPHDISVDYFGDTSAAPWGYRGLYYLLAQLLDLQTAGEWLAVLLLLLNVRLVWALASACEASRPELRALAAVTVMLVMLASPLTDIMSPLALQRSFALSFMLLCLWSLVRRRYFWLGISWLLAALVYPIVVVVMGLTAGLLLAQQSWRERRLPRATPWLALSGIAAITIVVLNMSMPAGVGPTITGDQARAMAEFRPGGRVPMFGMPPYADWLLDHHLALGYSLLQLALIGGATLYVLWQRRGRSIPPAAWAMLLVGLGVWLLSRQMLFTLYLPNRHARWSVACFALLAGSAAAVAAAEWFDQRRRAWRLPAWLTAERIIAVAAPLIVAAALLPGARWTWSQPVDADMMRAYRFLQTLPKSTLVAAHPDVADMVPMMARRSVLASTEISLPWGVSYYQKLRPRIEASLRAAYAVNMAEMDRALAPYGVNVVLTDASVWEKAGYYRPYDTLERSLRERGNRLGYALQSPPADRVLFRSGAVYVVRVQPPTGGAP